MATPNAAHFQHNELAVPPGSTGLVPVVGCAITAKDLAGNALVLYSDRALTTVITQPYVTTASGTLEAYVSTPQTVVLTITDNSGAASAGGVTLSTFTRTVNAEASPPPEYASGRFASQAVFLDIDGFYKLARSATRDLGPTTSNTDAGLVFAGLGGSIATYGNLSFLSGLALTSGQSGLAIFGPGMSRFTNVTNSLRALSGFTSGAIISAATTSITDLFLAFLNLKANDTNNNATAPRAIQFTGTDGHIHGLAASGGSTESGKIGGVRSTVVDADFGGSAGSTTVTLSGSDLIWVVGRTGSNSGGGSVLTLDTTMDGHQLVAIHTNGSGQSPNTSIAGDNGLLTNMYFDGVGGTASLRLTSAAGFVSLGQAMFRNGGSPGGIPLILGLGGQLVVTGAMSETHAGGGTWASVWDTTGHSGTPYAVFAANVFTALATPTIHGAFPEIIPALCKETVLLNGTPLSAGVTGSTSATSTGGIVQADVQASDATITSASYTAFSTPGPTITLYVGPSQTVVIDFSCSLKTSVAGNNAFVSVSVDGGTPLDADAMTTQAANLAPGSKRAVFTALSNGAHTFALMGKSDGTRTLTASGRRIVGETR